MGEGHQEHHRGPGPRLLEQRREALELEEGGQVRRRGAGLSGARRGAWAPAPSLPESRAYTEGKVNIRLPAGQGTVARSQQDDEITTQPRLLTRRPGPQVPPAHLRPSNSPGRPRTPAQPPPDHFPFRLRPRQLPLPGLRQPPSGEPATCRSHRQRLRPAAAAGPAGSAQGPTTARSGRHQPFAARRPQAPKGAFLLLGSPRGPPHRS